MTDSSDYLVGLDIGSSQVTCIVGRIVEVGPDAVDPETGGVKGEDTQGRVIRVHSMSRRTSSGISKGVIVDIDAVVKTIKEVVTDVERHLPFKIEHVVASIGGGSLRSLPCVGNWQVTNNEVQESDKQKAEASALMHAKKENQDLIKLFVQYWECGDTVTHTSPVGMSATNLTVHCLAVYGSVKNAENMKRCIQRTGLTVDKFLPHPWASAIAVLTPTEKLCGTLVIDLGAQTTSLSIMHEHVLIYTSVLPYGAEYFSRDLAMVCGLSLNDAEKLKVTSGHCLPEKIGPDEIVTTGPSTQRSNRIFPRQLLARTLNARAMEFFGLYRKTLEDADVLSSVHNIVLTGGGSKLLGILQIIRQVFPNVPVRIGRPRNVEPEVPRSEENAVCLGLVLNPFYDLTEPENHEKQKQRRLLPKSLVNFFCGEN